MASQAASSAASADSSHGVSAITISSSARRNCQRFLQTTFALPADNKIIKGWQEAGVDISKYKAIQTDDEEGINAPATYGIIPLFGTAKAEVVLEAWPRISQARFDALQTRIAERFDDAKIASAKREWPFVDFTLACRTAISPRYRPHPRQGAELRDSFHASRS